MGQEEGRKNEKPEGMKEGIKEKRNISIYKKYKRKDREVERTKGSKEISKQGGEIERKK